MISSAFSCTWESTPIKSRFTRLFPSQEADLRLAKQIASLLCRCLYGSLLRISHGYEILPPLALSVSLMSCCLAGGWPACVGVLRIDWNAAAAWAASGPVMVLCPRRGFVGCVRMLLQQVFSHASWSGGAELRTVRRAAELDNKSQCKPSWTGLPMRRHNLCKHQWPFHHNLRKCQQWRWRHEYLNVVRLLLRMSWVSPWLL